MAKLLYCMNTSLDGYVEDSTGGIDWSEPTEQVHTFINDLIRPINTYLFGRRMYEMMDFWETAHSLPDIPKYMLDFADVYREADKVVFSTTLQSVSRDQTWQLRRSGPASLMRSISSSPPSSLVAARSSSPMTSNCNSN